MNETAPSTKKLKSMLKMLSEHGVSRYKDSEVEICFGEVMTLLPGEEPRAKDFNFSNYEDNPRQSVMKDPVDDLGLSETDYLHWSSGDP
tara:strand:+ start:1443 stop:1709 length:267 start_codon:yes stop_codon:yes gene_type:complete